MNIINKKTGRFKSFDNTEIYFEVRGEGEPIVFCYGIGCLFNHWNHQLKYFSKNFMTVAFDYRGHNHSEVPFDYESMSVESIAKDLKATLEHLNLDSAHFVAHSFGGQVLIEAYKKYPELFKSITFINCFVSNPLQGMFGSDLPTKTFETIKRMHELLPDTVESLWKLGINNPISGALSALAGGFNLNLTSFKDIEIYSKGISHMDLKAFLSLFESMMKYDGTDYLKQIKCPTLIIGGKKDNVTPPEHQIKMHEAIPHSELSLMAYGSHCTQLDLPEYVNIRIEKFLIGTQNQQATKAPEKPQIDLAN